MQSKEKILPLKLGVDGSKFCAFLLSSNPPTKEVIHHVQQISCRAEQRTAFGAD